MISAGMQSMRASRSVQDWFASALGHYQAGRYDQAKRLCRKALVAERSHADALHLLGALAHRQGRLGQAILLVRQAIAANPSNASFHANLGGLYRESGRLDEASASLRKAIDMRPNHPQTHYGLGAILAEQQRFDEAESCLRLALELDPAYPQAHFDLGNVLVLKGRHEDAAVSFRRSLDARPDHAESHNNLGAMHKEMGRLDQAARCFRDALAAKPDLSDAHNNLANVLMQQMRLEEASEHYAQALTCSPSNFLAASNQILIENYRSDLRPETMLALARQYGALASSHATRPFTAWRIPARDEPLRVGVVSSDLRNHPVGFFLEALLGAVDPARLTFLAFPSHGGEDELTARIRPRFGAWTPIAGLPDVDAAGLIHASGVDVLLDLTGHTAHNRLPVFAWRPAPVQAAWLGYFATTGLAEIDYIIGDPIVAPPGEEDHFTETVVRLPDIYYCFTPPLIPVEVGALPALSSGHLTFGCFNNLTKINDAVLAVWARLLHAVPSSRLILKAPQLRDAGVCEMMRARFARHGIEGARLVLEQPSSRADYLRAYHQIDIALDPFPYPGGTTSFEALWMGVPVLTRRGDRFLSHAGETIMRNAGLPDWIASDDDDYVARAVRFAGDTGKLARLRAGLRDRVIGSPLFDAPRFARHFENAIRAMVDRRITPSCRSATVHPIHDPT